MQVQSFADLGVSSVVARAVLARGITAPFPVQSAVIPDVLAGRDVLVRSPTGSGKTLAFGLPLVDRIEADDPRCAGLVLVPTRELAAQITEELREPAAARALAIAAVYGGVGIDRQAKLARRAHIVVATPGRLEDLLERGALRLDRVRMLVLDEADRMLDMGFRPAVERIVARTPAERQTIFLSATLDGDTGKLAQRHTRNARPHEQEPPRRGPVEHRFEAVAREDRVARLIDALLEDRGARTLVFVRTKRGADRLVKRLKAGDVDALAMHGDKSQSQREKALARFEAGRLDALVATDVAARGIDVDGITHVINFDAPEDRDTYIHRVGRTGRAGRSGVGITFVTHDQARDVGRLASELRLHAQFAESGLSAQGGRDHGRPRPKGGPRRAAHRRATRASGRR